MAKPSDQYPITHTGMLRHVSTGRTTKVMLRDRDCHYCSASSGIMYRKSDGHQRGKKATPTWVLELGTVERV